MRAQEFRSKVLMINYHVSGSYMISMINLQTTIFLFLFLISYAADARKKKTQSIKLQGVVEKCHDGDTCRVQALGKSLKVRFSGIDTPELKQKHGEKARKFTEEKIKGRWVDLECEGRSYDRMTCIVLLEGKNINAEIVKHGWGYDSPKYSKGKFRPYQEEAKLKKIGVWQNSEALESPYCFRHPAAKACVKNRAFMP